MKIAFTGKKSMPTENYEEAKPAARPRDSKKEKSETASEGRDFNA